MKFQPFIVGSGMSAKAIAKALSVVNIVEDAVEVAPPIRVQRNQSLQGLTDGVENPVLCLGNPHGLHARYVLEGVDAGFDHMVLEKPVCVTLEEVEQLRGVTADVAVLHGFRQMWGPQTIKEMVARGELGQLMSIEGRYWQSSAAEIAVSDEPPADKTWKGDIALNGRYDTYLDLGTHWTDLVFFLAGEMPKTARQWLSHVNALADHRDTHNHIYFEFSNFRALGSISKTLHGAGNHLELNVLGQKQAATWRLQRPDEIEIGRGNVQTYVRRRAGRYGSHQPPFHGVGWLEGYTEVVRCSLVRRAGGDAPPPPSLQECLRVVESLLKAESL